MLIENIKCLMPDVLAVARRAGQAVLEIYEPFSSSIVDARLADKVDASPLTTADVQSHNVIVRGLGELGLQWPIVSEEDVLSLPYRSGYGIYWLIDPVDGTKEFLAKSGEFTVNIALVANGKAVWGVVYAPALDLLYWGGEGLGSYRQSGISIDRITVQEPKLRRRVVSSKSHFNEETRAFLNRLGDVELVHAGSSLKFCRVAEGEADIYPRLGPTCEWDTAAAQAVLEGAGGHVVDLKGRQLRYGKKEVLNPYFVALSDLELCLND